MGRGVSLLSKTVGFNELVLGGVGLYIGLVGTYHHAIENSNTLREMLFGGVTILGVIIVKNGYSILRRRYGPERASVEQLVGE